MKIFEPRMAYVPSARGDALVVTSERLLPACGSVSAIVPVHSPAYIRVISSRLSVSSPNASMRCAAPVVSPA